MSNLNCPNCGAVISKEKNQCSYCGTSYFDFSSMDINENKPFYLKIKMGNLIITQLVKASPDISITFESSPVYVKNYKGDSVCSFNTYNRMITNLKLEAVTDSTENKLCTIQCEG